MNARRLLCLIALALAAVATAAPASPAAANKTAKDGGIVRMGTTEPFDSMNPFVAFQAIGYEVVHERLSDARAVRHPLQAHRGLGEVLDDVEGRADLDVQGQAGQVVGRQAPDGR